MTTINSFIPTSNTSSIKDKAEVDPTDGSAPVNINESESLTSTKPAELVSPLTSASVLVLEKIEKKQNPLIDFFTNPPQTQEELEQLFQAMAQITEENKEFFSAFKLDESMSQSSQTTSLITKEQEWLKENKAFTTLQSNWIFNKYRQLGSYENITRFYETSSDNIFKQSDAIKSDYILALNRTGRYDDAFQFAAESIWDAVAKAKESGMSSELSKQAIFEEYSIGIGTALKGKYFLAKDLQAELEKPSELQNKTLLKALLGSYKQNFIDESSRFNLDDEATIENKNFLSTINKAGQDALEKSNEFYKQAFNSGLSYYAGINAVRTLLYLGKEKEAQELTKLVSLSAQQANTKKSFWTQATLLELSILTNDENQREKLLPRVLNSAKSEANTEMKSLIDHLQRWHDIENSEDKKDLLKSVIKRLATGINDPKDKYYKEIKSDPITEKIEECTFSTNDYRRGAVLPNRGIVPNTIVNLADRQLAREFVEYSGSFPPFMDGEIKPLHSIPVENVDEVRKWVHDYISWKFQLVNKETNKRDLEALDAPRHKDVIDRPCSEYLKLGGQYVSGTNLMNILALGLGDCRNVNFTNEDIINEWKNYHEESKMRKVYKLWEAGEYEKYSEAIGEIKKINLRETVVMQVTVKANIEVGGLYDIKKNENGIPLLSKDIEPGNAEEHTMTFEVIRDENNPEKIKKLIAVDPWYNDDYSFGNHVIEGKDLEAIMDKGYMVIQNGMKAYDKSEKDETKRLKSIDVYLAPAPYSKDRRIRTNRFDPFETYIAGSPCERPNMSHYFDENTINKLQRFISLLNERALKNVIVS